MTDHHCDSALRCLVSMAQPYVWAPSALYHRDRIAGGGRLESSPLNLKIALPVRLLMVRCRFASACIALPNQTTWEGCRRLRPIDDFTGYLNR